jgi:hypothetical protein
MSEIVRRPEHDSFGLARLRDRRAQRVGSALGEEPDLGVAEPTMREGRKVRSTLETRAPDQSSQSNASRCFAGMRRYTSGSSRGSLIERSRIGFGVTPAWSSTIAPTPNVLRIVSRATPSAWSLETTSTKSAGVSPSTARVPIRVMRLVELNAVLLARRVGDVDPGRLPGAGSGLSKRRAGSGSRVSSARSGIRSAASSDSIQAARIVASRFVRKAPPKRTRSSRPPSGTRRGTSCRSSSHGRESRRQAWSPPRPVVIMVITVATSRSVDRVRVVAVCAAPSGRL